MRTVQERTYIKRMLGPAGWRRRATVCDWLVFHMIQLGIAWDSIANIYNIIYHIYLRSSQYLTLIPEIYAMLCIINVDERKDDRL